MLMNNLCKEEYEPNICILLQLDSNLKFYKVVLGDKIFYYSNFQIFEISELIFESIEQQQQYAYSPMKFILSAESVISEEKIYKCRDFGIDDERLSENFFDEYYKITPKTTKIFKNLNIKNDY